MVIMCIHQLLLALGERSHLISRNIGLDTHILDINSEYKDSDEVTLVVVVMAV